ncbi:hypothetical protein HPB50_002118 [Hyalomma asiaticum]|uniref:Uncharacterized protein n=1 Tax=Hyalomma asiaticum TaxID=266040 RepID=A0ACB7T9J6_HYAAI|nr:hypothetical protein HPB50_002118 [Hyalomma asiaticum]
MEGELTDEDLLRPVSSTVQLVLAAKRAGTTVTTLRRSGPSRASGIARPSWLAAACTTVPAPVPQVGSLRTLRPPASGLPRANAAVGRIQTVRAVFPPAAFTAVASTPQTLLSPADRRSAGLPPLSRPLRHPFRVRSTILVRSTAAAVSQACHTAHTTPRSYAGAASSKPPGAWLPVDSPPTDRAATATAPASIAVRSADLVTKLSRACG